MGDEKSYLRLLEEVDNFNVNRITYKTLLGSPIALTYLYLFAFIVILLLLSMLCANLRFAKRRKVFVIFAFVVSRLFMNLFVGFGFQYPLAFEIPIILPTLLEWNVEVSKFFWVFFILLIFAVMIYQHDTLRANFYTIYFSFMFVVSFPEIRFFLARIEPIWFSIIGATYILCIKLLADKESTPNYSLIMFLMCFRLPVAIWLLMFKNFKFLSYLQVRRGSKPNIAQLFLVVPLLVHSLYRLFLGFLTEDTNQAIVGFSQRTREFYNSLMSIFGTYSLLVLLLFTFLIISLKRVNIGFKTCIVIGCFLSLVPKGAISDEKYIIELFTPIATSVVAWMIIQTKHCFAAKIGFRRFR